MPPWEKPREEKELKRWASTSRQRKRPISALDVHQTESQQTRSVTFWEMAETLTPNLSARFFSWSRFTFRSNSTFIYTVCSHERIKIKTGLRLTPALLSAPVEKTDEGLIILSPISNKENWHGLMHDLQVKKELHRPSESVLKSEARAATHLKMNWSPQPVNQTWRTEAQVDAWKGFAFTFMAVFTHTQKTLGVKFQSSNYLAPADWTHT